MLYKISINPLCDFVTGSARKKASIIRSQKNPSKFMVARYKTAKTRMSRFVKNGFTYQDILSGIADLQTKQCTTDFQKNDRKASIEALRLFLELQFPTNFKKLKCSFSTDKRKDVEFNNVSITVSPDLILRWEEDGQKYIGGIKFHISKSNIFDYEKASFAAGLIHLYLKESIACNDEIVVDDYCLCVDVFGSKICSTPKNKKDFNSKLYKACDEIKSLWEVA